MMKKIIYFLAALLLLLGTANINAQVTIGAERDPHPGAVLDLNTSPTKGLLLPNVYLTNVAEFGPLTGDKVAAAGMLVYNTNPNIIDGEGEGVYVWNGAKWMKGFKPYVALFIVSQSAATLSSTVGSVMTLSVTTGGSNLKYQWYSGTIGSGTKITDATATSYQTPQLALVDFQYYCIGGSDC